MLRRRLLPPLLDIACPSAIQTLLSSIGRLDCSLGHVFFLHALLLGAVTLLESSTILLFHILSLHVILGSPFLTDLSGRLLVGDIIIILDVALGASLGKRDTSCFSVIFRDIVKDTVPANALVGLLLPFLVQLSKLDLLALDELSTFQPNLLTPRVTGERVAHRRLDVLALALVPSHHALTLH